MRVEFTEYTENDAEYNAGDGYKFGGWVTITAEGVEDADLIVDRFKLANGKDPASLIERARLMQIADLQHIHRPTKRPYYEVSGSLDVALFQPYRDWAKRTFGFDGRFPDLKLEPKWRGLCYTHICTRLEIEVGETVCYTAFTQSEPWNGRTAQQYAERCVRRYIAEQFGHVEPIREFIQGANGHYQPNPDWGTGKRNPVTPRVTHDGLCRAFVAWWLASDHPTDAQRDILRRNEAVAEKTGKHSRPDWLKGWGHIYYADDAGTIDYDGKGLKVAAISHSDFAAL